MTTTKKPGDIITHGYQADVFGGQYRLIEQISPSVWIVEDVEPSDECLDAITAYYFDETHTPYTGYVDPYGPGRRIATREEAADAEVQRRIEQVGTRSTVQFVSAAEYGRAF